jgi:LacI family transcriptional regulator
MKLPTQTDIARIAGVSRATVSYVLSDSSGSQIKVSEHTAQRILQVAKDLGYEPNAAAQSLRLSVTRNIGITLPDLNNPHMQEILSGAAHEAQKSEHNLLLVCTEMKPEYEKTSIRELLRKRIDGLVLIPTYVNILEEEYQLLAQRHSPIVVAGNYYDHITCIDTVIPGHDVGAHAVMNYLLELGHRRIAVIFGVLRKPFGTERLAVYQQMLQEQGIEYDPDLVLITGTNYEDGYQAALQLLDLKPPPTAIIAINDVLATGALHAFMIRGVKVPDEISLLGFDDNDISAFTNPALTTLRINAREIGKVCVQLVRERINHPEKPFENIRIPSQLIVRASTGPVPGTMEKRRRKKTEEVVPIVSRPDDLCPRTDDLCPRNALPVV